jgi:hypothetical protein
MGSAAASHTEWSGAGRAGPLHARRAPPPRRAPPAQRPPRPLGARPPAHAQRLVRRAAAPV